MERLQSYHYIGDQLRQRREEQCLTLDEVANHLRLKKELIEAIEKGNCEKIQPTYLIGYLRSYAKLLAMTDAEIFQALNFSHKNESMKGWKIFHTQKQVSASDKVIQWITLSIISVLILLVTLWWKSDNSLNINLSAQDTQTMFRG